jgi:hypothetical protein
VVAAQSVSTVVQQYCQELCLSVQTSFRRVATDQHGPRPRLPFLSLAPPASANSASATSPGSSPGPVRAAPGTKGAAAAPVSPLEATVRHNCIKLNNLEAVRARLHELYAHMDVDAIMAVLETHNAAEGTATVSPASGTGDDGGKGGAWAGLTGSIKVSVHTRARSCACTCAVAVADQRPCIYADVIVYQCLGACVCVCVCAHFLCVVAWVTQLEILAAAALKACDPNGKSDPYVVVTLVSRDGDGNRGGGGGGGGGPIVAAGAPRRSVAPAALARASGGAGAVVGPGEHGRVVATTTIKFGKREGAPVHKERQRERGTERRKANVCPCVHALLSFFSYACVCVCLSLSLCV